MTGSARTTHRLHCECHRLRTRVERFAIVAAALGSACERQQAAAPNASRPPAEVQVTPRPLREVFHLARSVDLPANGPTTVTSVHSLDVKPDGTMLITDRRSHNVKVISAAGDVIVIGRLGSGPGEFRAPWDGRFMAGGGFVIADPELERITLFDSTNTYERSFATPGQDPRLVLPMADSTIIVAGLVDVGTRNNLLGRYSRTGVRRAGFFHADTLVFKIGLVLDGPWAAAAGPDQLFAGLAVVPAVTKLDTHGSIVAANTASPPGWRQLQPENRPTQGLAAVRNWIGSGTLAGPAFTLEDGRLYLAFQQALGDSEAYRLAVYSPEAALVQVLSHLPGRPVTGRGRSIYFVIDREDGTTRIERFDATSIQPVGRRATDLVSP